jgi:hypothetical protein
MFKLGKLADFSGMRRLCAARIIIVPYIANAYAQIMRNAHMRIIWNVAFWKHNLSAICPTDALSRQSRRFALGRAPEQL